MLHAALSLQPAGKHDATTLAELVDFAWERLRAYLVGQIVEDRPISSETFEAVCALDITQPLDFQRRLLAVHTFGAHAAAPNLAAANKRVRNIIKQTGDVCGNVQDRHSVGSVTSVSVRVNLGGRR